MTNLTEIIMNSKIKFIHDCQCFFPHINQLILFKQFLKRSKQNNKRHRHRQRQKLNLISFQQQQQQRDSK